MGGERERLTSAIMLTIRAMENYEEEYKAVKASRKLCWLPALGTVEIELAGPNDEQQSFTVSPIQAAIIYQFQEQGASMATLRSFFY